MYAACFAAAAAAKYSTAATDAVDADAATMMCSDMRTAYTRALSGGKPHQATPDLEHLAQTYQNAALRKLTVH